MPPRPAMLASDRLSTVVTATEPATPTPDAPTPDTACVEMRWPAPSSSLWLPNLSVSSAVNAS